LDDQYISAFAQWYSTNKKE